MCNLVTRVSHLPAPMERERRDSENEVAVYEEAMPRRARLGKKKLPLFFEFGTCNLSQSFSVFILLFYHLVAIFFLPEKTFTLTLFSLSVYCCTLENSFQNSVIY